MLTHNRLTALPPTPHPPFVVFPDHPNVTVEYIDPQGEVWQWHGRPAAVMVWIGRYADRGWISWEIHNRINVEIWRVTK